MKGTLISSTPLSSIQPLAVQGIITPDCHAQITDIVRKHLGEEYAWLFAEPVFDKGRGVVDWYTQADATPIQVLSLEEERKNNIFTQFSTLAEKLTALADKLKNSGKRSDILAGEILQMALHYPGADALYLVGEQPVVVSWGCGPAEEGVEAQELMRLGEAKKNPLQQSKPGAIQGAEQKSELAGVKVISDRFRPVSILPWILALILLFILSAILYAWLSGCLADMLGKLSFAEPGQKDTLQTRLHVATAKKNDLLKEIEKMRLLLIEKRGQCVGKALSLPDNMEKSSLDFLEGTWVCDTGLTDSNNIPVRVIYSFDNKGMGKIIIESSQNGICNGLASATLIPEKGINITTDPEITCTGNVSFRGQDINCTGRGSDTSCEGRNIPGGVTWKANFYRR